MTVHGVRRGLPVALLAILSLVLVTGSAAVRTQTVAPPTRSAAPSVPIDGGGEQSLPLPPLPGVSGEPPAGPGTADATTSTPATYVVAGGTGIPAQVLAAYRAAAAAMARLDPGCHLPWTLLAGIGRIESGHARGGALRPDGTTIAPILGPVLSGGPGVAAIRDTDDGRFDGDRSWDRAVGPMQFIPSSWAVYGQDANGDGVASPHNVRDAALASAQYLCAGDRDLAQPQALRRAVFGYNHSWAYVNAVLAWMRAYASNGALATTPSLTGATFVTAGRQEATSATRGGTTRQPGTGQGPGPTPAPAPSPGTTPPAGNPTPSPSSSATPTSEPTSSSPGPSPSPSESQSPDCPTPSPSPSPSTSGSAEGEQATTSTPAPSPTQVDHATQTETATGTDSPGNTDTPTPEGCPTESPTPTPSSIGTG